ncbi:hypothetical protein SEA_NHAGOS_77 [Gordonia phage NHagos]|nr:hypothetical protein SEA_NHAGOS_77 [Gordonia phage NHagos]
MSTITIVRASGAFEAKATDVLSGMIEAQNEYGQVTWTTITEGVSYGRFPVPGSSLTEWKRVAVADLDTLDARAAFDLAAWAAGHTA